ncbi:MAG TPA: hypothetical protein VF824_02180 [Thermoanaerobaculia bacterium]|jgi:hypothetical protein
MPEHIQYEDDDLFNPETHHEESDVPIRPLFVFIGIFIAFAVVSHVVLWFLYKGMARHEKARMDPAPTSIGRPADADVPKDQPLLQPFPRVVRRGENQTYEVAPQQDTPVTDLADMRKAEDQVLHNYGWVDKQKGVVHIPIELAQQLAAQRLAAASAPRVIAPVPPAPAASQSTPSPAGKPVPADTGVAPGAQPGAQP